MFTGLVQSLGRASFLDPYHLRIRYVSPPAFAPQVELGDSIAVDGVCLTVAACLPAGDGGVAGFQADVSEETLRRSGLAQRAAAGSRDRKSTRLNSSHRT